MGRVYTASRQGVAVTTANDIFEISAPASNAIVLLSAFVGQSSDAGDAAAEMLRIQIARHTASSSGGGTTTPLRHFDVAGGMAFGGTVEHSNTFVATNNVILEETFNVQAGWYYTPVPEERIIIPPSGRLAISLPAAPADSLTMSVRATFETIG